MIKILQIIFLLIVLISCQKQENFKYTRRTAYKYEGVVSPYEIKVRNNNTDGQLYDTLVFDSWRDVYEDDGLLINLNNYSQLAGSTWIIKSFYQTGHIFIEPNDTIHFNSNNTYTLFNANTGQNYSHSYHLMPNTNGMSLTLEIEYIHTFGLSGSWVSCQLPWHALDGNEFMVYLLKNKFQTSEKVKSVHFIEIN